MTNATGATGREASPDLAWVDVARGYGLAAEGLGPLVRAILARSGHTPETLGACISICPEWAAAIALAARGEVHPLALRSHVKVTCAFLGLDGEEEYEVWRAFQRVAKRSGDRRR